jgi:hypothetical protein
VGVANPQSVVFDANGNYYIASSYLRQVFKVDTTNNITVFAGNGAVCYPFDPSPACGDGGPATSANLTLPYGLAIDATGNIYISDVLCNRVRMVDTSGIIHTFAGNGTQGYSGDGGPATSASLNLPFGVAVDPSGDVFIADMQNNRIRIVDTTGTINTFAGNGSVCVSTGPNQCGDGGPATSASLAFPMGVATGPPPASPAFPSLFIADTSGSRIRVVYSSGQIVTAAGVGSPLCPNGPPCSDPHTGTDASLARPQGVAVLRGWEFLGIADTGYNRVVAVALNPLTFQGQLVLPAAGTGSGGYNGDGELSTTASVNGPTGLAYLPANDSFYLADTGNNRIRTWPLVGSPISTVAGNGTPAYWGDGGLATHASFSYPAGVAMDPTTNDFYIPDADDNCVRKVTTATGDISTIAGIPGQRGYSGDGGAATSALLNNPSGVALDATGKFLYIADANNGVVRMVDLNAGTISTVAGSVGPCRGGVEIAMPPNGALSWQLGYCYSGDGGPATSASLGNPSSVALDPAGNLFIADSGNNLILEVTKATGNISTVAGNGTQCFSTYPAPCYSGDCGPATSAALFQPSSVAVDAVDDVYIADSGNSRIRVVYAPLPGDIYTFAGNGIPGFSGDGVSGGAASASLNLPMGVWLDFAGNLYIADTANFRIRKVDNTQTITTVAGTGIAGFSGDGGSPTNADLGAPAGGGGGGVDKAGGLLIADSANRRIRRVTNTSVGNNVTVAPVDSTSGTTPVAVTFAAVTQAGNVGLATSSAGPATPAEFMVGSPPTYYNLVTSAAYDGYIQVCIDYSGISYNNPAQLTIWHYDTATSTWTQLTTSPGPTPNTACATTPSMSPFSLVEPRPPLTFSTRTLKFHPQREGTKSWAHELRLSVRPPRGSKSKGDQKTPLKISSITVDGKFFSLVTTRRSCPYNGGIVKAGASCTIDVIFDPTGPGGLGPQTGSIVLDDDAADSPQSISLSGRGMKW